MTRLFILLTIISLFSLEGLAQRVLYSSQDLDQRYVRPVIRDVIPNGIFSSNITVLYQDGRRERIPRRSIWGYEDRKNRVYRYYEGSFLQVVEIGELVKYTHQGIISDGILIENTYFSKTLDSAIHITKHRAAKDVAKL